MQNFGTSAEVFDIECVITPGGYADTFAGFFLLPGSELQCSFAPWTVPLGNTSYTVCVQTLLPGDINPSNDSLCKGVFAEGQDIHDVGVESISSPPDTVIPTSSHAPTAWIRNYGAYSETFDVECLITPSGYVDTLSVANLSSGTGVECTFSQWDVPTDDSTAYSMEVTCLMPADANPENDTMSKGIYAVYSDLHDAGICGIASPPDTVGVGFSYDPSVCVENYGGFSETFWTFCRIDSSGDVLYLDSMRVNNLHPGRQRHMGFPSWTVPMRTGVVYNTCAWVALWLDSNPNNDSLCKTSYSMVGVEELARRSEVAGPLLHHSAPNPFGRQTRIVYEAAEPGFASITIFDATGSRVRTVVDRDVTAGTHQAFWNGRNEDGTLLPEGVYFCKLTLGDFKATRKLVLLR